VIAVAQSVMQWLAGAVVEAAVKESSPSVVSYLRRLFRRADGAKPAARPPALTADQARQVRAVAYQQALAAGLEPARAGLIADSTAGALVTAG
jgi:hypothetical protein